MAVGWDLFFDLHLEKLEALAKICIVASSHTYATEKVRDERASHPPLCKFSIPLLNPGSAPDVFIPSLSAMHEKLVKV